MSGEAPQDLILRLRQMLMGQNPEAPFALGSGASNPDKGTTFSVNSLSLPSEREGYQRSMNTLSSRVGYADPSLGVNGYLGMTALEGSGPRGFTGYEPQIGFGYGPVNVMGGYRTMTANEPGAKNRNSYVYGGNIAIPLDDAARDAPGQGVSAVLSGMGSTARNQTQLTAGLQAPFAGGLLGVDVSADPRLRRREIIAGWRREF